MRICLEHRMSQVWVPPEAAHFSLKITELHCVCVVLLFFGPDYFMMRVNQPEAAVSHLPGLLCTGGKLTNIKPEIMTVFNKPQSPQQSKLIRKTCTQKIHLLNQTIPIQSLCRKVCKSSVRVCVVEVCKSLCRKVCKSVRALNLQMRFMCIYVGSSLEG